MYTKVLNAESEGQFQLLSTGILGLVTIGIVASVGALVLGKMDNLTDTGGSLANADANTAVGNALTGITDSTSLFPVLGIVIVAAVVIGFLALFNNQR